MAVPINSSTGSHKASGVCLFVPAGCLVLAKSVKKGGKVANMSLLGYFIARLEAVQVINPYLIIFNHNRFHGATWGQERLIGIKSGWNVETKACSSGSASVTTVVATSVVDGRYLGILHVFDDFIGIVFMGCTRFGLQLFDQHFLQGTHFIFKRFAKQNGLFCGQRATRQVIWVPWISVRTASPPNLKTIGKTRGLQNGSPFTCLMNHFAGRQVMMGLRPPRKSF